MVACYTGLYDQTSTSRRYCWDNDIIVTNAVNPLVYIEIMHVTNKVWLGKSI